MAKIKRKVNKVKLLLFIIIIALKLVLADNIYSSLNPYVFVINENEIYFSDNLFIENQDFIEGIESDIKSISLSGDSTLMIVTENCGVFFIHKGENRTRTVVKSFDGFDKKYNIFETVDLTDGLIDPENSSRAIVSSLYYVYKTLDMGDTWQKVNKKSLLDITAISADFENETIIAGTSIRGLFIKQGEMNDFMPLSQIKTSTAMGRHEAVSFIEKRDGKLEFTYGIHFNNCVLNIDLSKDYAIQNDTIVAKSTIVNPICSHSQQAVNNTLFSLAKTEFGSIFFASSGIYFKSENEIAEINNLYKILKGNLDWDDSFYISHIAGFNRDKNIYSAFIPYFYYEKNNPHLNERMKVSDNKISIYMPAHVISSTQKAETVVNSIKGTKVNAVVVDLKDDFGYIRYNSSLEIVRQISSLRPFIRDLEKLLGFLHENGVYFIARIVVFQDPLAFKYKNNKYAVWDCAGDSAFHTKEYWVDPYSDFQAEYVSQIAGELEIMGVDEIQLDYIRFPTDNLISTLCYRHRKDNSTRRDALEKFLKTVRQSVDIPISVDIYGGSGWSKRSTYVAQDLDMLKKYCDIVSPMYYPSHFPDDFLDDDPKIERVWRIYYNGTYRARELSGFKMLVRPYVQAFCLQSVSRYDKFYCSWKDYMDLQVKGCLESDSNGMSFWNGAGNYSILRGVYKGILQNK